MPATHNNLAEISDRASDGTGKSGQDRWRAGSLSDAVSVAAQYNQVAPIGGPNIS